LQAIVYMKMFGQALGHQPATRGRAAEYGGRRTYSCGLQLRHDQRNIARRIG
jgi:hypothetical protein